MARGLGGGPGDASPPGTQGLRVGGQGRGEGTGGRTARVGARGTGGHGPRRPRKRGTGGGGPAAQQARPLARPACLVAGGETTVTVRGSGLGGRNQELALAAVVPLAGLSNVALLSLGTDGSDGPTDAAGAMTTGLTASRAAARELEPRAFLANNDAYHFFQPLGDLIKTGPTNTNVNDLVLLFAW